MLKIFDIFKSLRNSFWIFYFQNSFKNSVCFERTLGKIENKNIVKIIVNKIDKIFLN